MMASVEFSETTYLSPLDFSIPLEALEEQEPTFFNEISKTRPLIKETPLHHLPGKKEILFKHTFTLVLTKPSSPLFPQATKVKDFSTVFSRFPSLPTSKGEAKPFLQSPQSPLNVFTSSPLSRPFPLFSQEGKPLPSPVSSPFSSQKETKTETSSLRRHELAASTKEEALTKKEEPILHKNPYEREGGQKDQQHKRQDQEEDLSIEEIEGIQSSSPSSSIFSSPSLYNPFSPTLQAPQAGIFSLTYMMDKLGIASEGSKYAENKEEIETTQAEQQKIYQERLEKMKEALKHERSTSRWSVMTKVMSWFGIFASILTGITLIASGVGAIAGAMLVVGGVIQLTSQILEVTGGWQKIAEILPGDDAEQKKTVIAWIQIGIAIFSILLSGVGVITGGMTAVKGAMATFQLATGAISATAVGVVTLGQGISSFLHKRRLAEAKDYEVSLTRIKHRRDDLFDHVEDAPDRLLHYYESISRMLGFLEEINAAHQRAWR